MKSNLTTANDTAAERARRRFELKAELSKKPKNSQKRIAKPAAEISKPFDKISKGFDKK